MQCSACDYKSNGIGDLSRHRNAEHADLRKKYNRRKKKVLDTPPPGRQAGTRRGAHGDRRLRGCDR